MREIKPFVKKKKENERNYVNLSGRIYAKTN